MKIWKEVKKTNSHYSEWNWIEIVKIWNLLWKHSFQKCLHQISDACIFFDSKKIFVLSSTLIFLTEWQVLMLSMHFYLSAIKASQYVEVVWNHWKRMERPENIIQTIKVQLKLSKISHVHLKATWSNITNPRVLLFSAAELHSSSSQKHMWPWRWPSVIQAWFTIKKLTSKLSVQVLRIW